MTDNKNSAFFEWVERWGISPGMNDVWRVEHANAIRANRGEPALPMPTTYCGYDGKVGPGWVPILDRLAARLKQIGWDGSVLQIKEKFGTLCFYAVPNGVPPEQRDAFRDDITKAEIESGVTCEDCGSTSNVTTNPLPNRSWIRTLCKVCRESTEPTT